MTTKNEQDPKSQAAQLLGSIKSEKKAQAARENGKKGGRPLSHYMHIVTGEVDGKEGWISSYSRDELESRGLTAEEAFGADKGKTLMPCSARRKKNRTTMSREK